MCWKTDVGLVQSVGKIKLEEPNKHPKYLQSFRYVIFKEEEDMLGLIYHAVCIDLALNSRGKTPSEACKSLRNSIDSFIDVTLSRTAEKSKAYNALKEQKENRSETRELVFRVYNEVLAHNNTIIYKELRPHYKHLFDTVYLKLSSEDLPYNYNNFYVHAYSVEDIKSLYHPKKSPSGKIRKIVVSNDFLLNNNVKCGQLNTTRQKRVEMV